MAKIIRATVNLEIDGAPLKGFPVSKRISVDEVQSFSVDVTSGSFSNLPADSIGTKQFFLLQPDQVTTFRFADGASGDIQVSAGGLLLLIDGTVADDLEANPSTNAVVDGTVGGT